MKIILTQFEEQNTISIKDSITSYVGGNRKDLTTITMKSISSDFQKNSPHDPYMRQKLLPNRMRRLHAK